MQTSKAFRCQLPALRDDQLGHLRRWAANNCAHAVFFRDSSGLVVLMALRDRLRTAASHSRTVRAALKNRGIDDSRLRGKWLHLITPTEVLAMGLTESGRRAPPDPRVPDAIEDEDIRIVPLR